MPDEPIPDDDVIGGYVGPDPFAERPPAEPRRTTRRGSSGIVAAAMLGLREVLDPPKDDQHVTWQASGDPGDLDADGLDVEVEGVRATAPPLPPLPPRPPRPARRRRR